MWFQRKVSITGMHDGDRAWRVHDGLARMRGHPGTDRAKAKPFPCPRAAGSEDEKLALLGHLQASFSVPGRIRLGPGDHADAKLREGGRATRHDSSPGLRGTTLRCSTRRAAKRPTGM